MTPFSEFARIFSAVNFAAQGLGRAAAYVPDFATASQNIKKTLASIHRETQMDVTQGDYPPDPPVGKFEFKNVYFRYPTRRRIPILRVYFSLQKRFFFYLKCTICCCDAYKGYLTFVLHFTNARTTKFIIFLCFKHT